MSWRPKERRREGLLRADVKMEMVKAGQGGQEQTWKCVDT